MKHHGLRPLRITTALKLGARMFELEGLASATNGELHRDDLVFVLDSHAQLSMWPFMSSLILWLPWHPLAYLTALFYYKQALKKEPALRRTDCMHGLMVACVALGGKNYGQRHVSDAAISKACDRLFSKRTISKMKIRLEEVLTEQDLSVTIPALQDFLKTNFHLFNWHLWNDVTVIQKAAKSYRQKCLLFKTGP